MSELFARSPLRSFEADSIRSITPSPNQAGYRNRVKLVPVRVRGQIRLGLYRAGSHKVVDIPGCPVQTDGINETVEIVRTAIERFNIPLYDEGTHTSDLRFVTVRQSSGTGEILIGLVTRTQHLPHADAITGYLMDHCSHVVGVVQNINTQKGNVIFGPMSRLLAGRDYLEETVCDVRIRLGITSFFQVNTAVAVRAYESILRNVTSESSGGSDMHGALVGEPPVAPQSVAAEDVTLLDLYAGVGTIGLVATRHVGWVYGIEESSEATELARVASRINGFYNIHFREGLVEENLPELFGDLCRQRVSGDRLVAIVNPPRKGVGATVADLLLEVEPARIAYLSCEPNTLLRDILRFEAGGYRVVHVELFDMFPQTEQVETLAVLHR